MNRIATALAVASLACGSPDALQVKVEGVEAGADGSALLRVTAGKTLTVPLLALGQGAGEASFVATGMPAFGSLIGSVLSFAPAESDVGDHAFAVTACARGSCAGVRLVVSVASGCGACGPGQTCGGGGTPGVCGSPRWARWASGFGTAGDDSVDQVAVDANGNVFAAGRLGTEALFLREYGSDGSLILDKRWTLATGSIGVHANGLGVAQGGSIFLSFEAWCLAAACPAPDLGLGAGTGTVIAALDASGSIVWQLDSASPDGKHPRYRWLEVGATGEVAVGIDDDDGSYLALLESGGTELWRRAQGTLRSTGPNVVVDAQGYITAINFYGPYMVGAVWRAPSLIRYDASGNTVWEIPLNPWEPSIAATPGGDIFLVDDDPNTSSSVLRRYRGSDGALAREVPIAHLADRVATDGDRILIVGSGFGACPPEQLVTYDLDGALLSNVSIGSSCTALTASALALAPGGDAIVAGQFASPFDFSTGTDYLPRGKDAFVVDVSR